MLLWEKHVLPAAWSVISTWIYTCEQCLLFHGYHPVIYRLGNAAERVVVNRKQKGVFAEYGGWQIIFRSMSCLCFIAILCGCPFLEMQSWIAGKGVARSARHIQNTYSYSPGCLSLLAGVSVGRLEWQTCGMFVRLLERQSPVRRRDLSQQLISFLFPPVSHVTNGLLK